MIDDERSEEEKAKAKFGKLVLGIIVFFSIAIMIIGVYYGIIYSPEKQLEDRRLEQIDSKTMQEIKQTIQFQKDNPDVDMFCLDETRQRYEEMGISVQYEQAYQASCVKQNQPNNEIDPETFCTDKNKQFYENLGMSNIYKEIASKKCHN